MSSNGTNVKISQQADYVQVEFSPFPTNEDAKEFLQLATELFEQSPKDFVFVCDSLRELNQTWRRTLTGFALSLKKKGKQVRMAGAGADLARSLKQDGLDQSLRCCLTVRAALIELGYAKEHQLDVRFINPFLTSTIKVLSTQAATEARPGQIFKKSARDHFQGDISGVIGLISEAFTGSVVISFPAPTFLGIMSRMLGENITEVSKEIEDGAGELTNIIFGQSKTILNELGYGIKTALPSVITGKDHSVLQMSTGPRVVIPFETDTGPFFVEICLSA